MKFVGVKFVNQYVSSTVYVFRSIIEDLKEKDLVVVDTSAGLAVAEIVSVTDEASKKATRWVISRVDLTEHNLRLQNEKRLRELTVNMNKRIKQIQEEKELEYYAESDVVMKGLLTEYRTLGGV